MTRKRLKALHFDHHMVEDVSELVKPGRNTLALRVRSDQGPKWGAGAAQHAYGSQWSLGNIKGGLLNITIKSLGAMAKAGTTRRPRASSAAITPS
mgnify:CR=1 FL=1